MAHQMLIAPPVLNEILKAKRERSGELQKKKKRPSCPDSNCVTGELMCFTVLKHLTPNTRVFAALGSCWVAYCGVWNSSLQFYTDTQVSSLQEHNAFPVRQIHLLALNTTQDKTYQNL